MKFPWSVPWAFRRGRSARSAHPRAQVSPACAPRVEILEERLVLSTTDPGAAPSHDAWAAETFHLDDAAMVVGPQVETNAVTAQDAQSAALIGLDNVLAYSPYRGTGYSVVVIDTGIDYRHPALGGGWGTRVVAGWDFVNNDADPMDDNGHGTHVAGIIGSSDTRYPGLAPDVNLIALKVLGSDGSGTFGNVERALQWVVQNQARYNIAAINLSLGSGNYMSNPYAYLDDEFASLGQEGVFIAVASGNSYYTFNSAPGDAFPATSPAVVSVGAVWSSDFGSVYVMWCSVFYTTAPDRITSFTQRSPNLDLLAPGALITSTARNGQFVSMAGTSMAAPMVAGAAALLHQALDNVGKSNLANQAGILAILKQTGVTVVDGDDENDNVVNTGLSFKRIDIWAALSSLGDSTPPDPDTNQPPVLGPVADVKIKPGSSALVTLAASDPNGDPVSYSAQLVTLSSDAYQMRLQYGLTYTGSYFTNSWGANEKWLLGSSGQWYCLMPNGDLRRWADTIDATLQASNLLASLGKSFYDDPSLLWNATAPAAPDVTLSLVGNQLRITPAASYVGTFQVQIRVSDGLAADQQTFTVSVNNAGPTFVGLLDTSIRPNQATTLTLSATDPDGDRLAYGARLGGLSLLAVQMKQKLGLRLLSTDKYNRLGLGERWIGGKTSALNYIVLPNGELRRWTGNLTTTLASKSLIATFDSTFHADLTKLTKPVQPTLRVVGNQLTITPPKGFLGTFTVEASVSDNESITVQTFEVTVSNQAPSLSVGATATTLASGAASLVLDGTDSDGDTLSYSAKVSLVALNLRKSLGLTAMDASNDNKLGLDETWFAGKSKKSYFLLPNGQLRRFTGGLGSDGVNGVLVARLDAMFHDDPTLLTQAVNPAVKVQVIDNVLIVTPKSGFRGTVLVEIGVSDGTAVTTKLVAVSVG